MTPRVSFTALLGIPEVEPGDDLPGLLAAACDRAGAAPQSGDLLVVAQKIVSKSEGRFADLATVAPSQQAWELSEVTGKDARLVQLILSESSEVIRAHRGVLIVRHRLGYVMANAGIDRSNVKSAPGEETVLLLPRDPDASALALREALARRLGFKPGIIISDSFGRPWREGTVNVALGAAGLPALVDRRGEIDRHGRVMEMTQVAVADALAAAAGLVMGETAEGVPAVLAQGLSWTAPHRNAQALIRPLAEDLFR